MAKNIVAQAPTQTKPLGSILPVQQPTPTPAVPVKPVKVKKVKVKLQAIFASAAEAEKGAAERKKGPRRVFVVTTPDGRTIHVVHANEGRAAGAAAISVGFRVEEPGAKKKAAKVEPTMDGVMEAAKGLVGANPTDLAAVIAELQKLMQPKA